MTRMLVCAAVAVTSVAAMVVTSTSSSATKPVNSPWPQTNGNAALSRANHTETTLKPANVRKVRLLRTVQPPPLSDDEDCVVGATPPVLSGGHVYSVVGGQLSKINAASGVVEWATPAGVLDATYVVDLAVVDGTVVLDEASCHSESDPGRLIRAFDAATGSVRWEAHAEGLGNMVVSQGYVVVIGGFMIGLDIQALRLTDGSVAWSKTAGCVMQAQAAVVAGLVTYTWCDEAGGYLEADRLRTGARVWTTAKFSDVKAGDTDTIGGRNLFVTGADGALHDLDPATGRNRYTLVGASRILAVGPKRVFATCSDDGDTVCAYRLRTGARQWTRTHPNASSLAALADGVLYLSNGAAVRAATGTHLIDVYAPPAPGYQGALAVGDGRVVTVAQPPDDDPSYLAIYGLPGS